MVTSKSFLSIIFLVFVFSGFAQVPPPRHLSVKVYDKSGKLILPSDKNYSISAKFWSEWSRNKKTEIPRERIKGEKAIEVVIDYSEGVTMEIVRNNKKMILHTQGNIDSIPFREGEYFINRYENYLFSISLGNQQSWSDFSLENFKMQKHKSPTFQLEESRYNLDDKERGCIEFARKLEEKHGGKNWAMNTCVDIYKNPFVIDSITDNLWVKNELAKGSSKLRISIYPFLQTKYIKHEFILGDTYDHRFSITEDKGKTWQEIMYLKSEWYVHLVYFPQWEKIGIDASNSGVVLLSDYDLKKWKYYIANYDEEYEEYDENDELIPRSDDKIGLVLENANWYENYFGNFSFSD